MFRKALLRIYRNTPEQQVACSRAMGPGCAVFGARQVSPGNVTSRPTALVAVMPYNAGKICPSMANRLGRSVR